MLHANVHMPGFAGQEENFPKRELNCSRFVRVRVLVLMLEIVLVLLLLLLLQLQLIFNTQIR